MIKWTDILFLMDNGTPSGAGWREFMKVFLVEDESMMRSGIKNNMPVINAGGLVGRVVKTSAAYSNVYSILDTRSSVSVKSARTGDAGIVTGDYVLMEQGLCRMEYIDSDAEIVEGDEIITSGLSEYYPEGISVGYDKEIHQDENGLTKYAVIQPKVDFKQIDTVLVVQEVQDKPSSAEVN